MKVPLRWLADFVPLTLPTDDLAKRLTLSGTEVEGIERTGVAWEGLVVGRILTLARHPNADRLQVASVDIGTGRPATIVCGAANIAPGQAVPVVLPGTKLGDLTIQRRRVRGVESEGMLCSPRELGLSEDHSGIHILDAGAAPGTPLSEVLGDSVLDLYITPNRPDCLSIQGIAREVAALTGQRLRPPATAEQPSHETAFESLRERADAAVHDEPRALLRDVVVEDPDLCPRYAARLVRGVTVGPSPDWLRRRLEAAGLRAINNVVDVSNYVMLEIGQPLHTFDFARLAGGTVVVRRAHAGETLRTLDGVDRALTPATLAICDAWRPIAIAGVMGGLASEVGEATRDVLIESASFAPGSIRRTSQALGLRTEASIRFERGIDPAYVGPALERAATLLREVAGGTPSGGVIDRYPAPEPPRVLDLDAAAVEALLGAAYPPDVIEGTLGALGYRLERRGPGCWRVGVPSFRRDVTVPADLIEDVARIQGYDAIPATLPATPPPPTQVDPWLSFETNLRALLLEVGLTETVSYPLTSKDSMARLLAAGAPAEGGPAGPLPSLQPAHLAETIAAAVTVRNPLSPEWTSLRVSLLDSLLRTLAANVRHVDALQVFELGRVYIAGESARLPEERRALAVGMAGEARPQTWLAPARAYDFWSIKGALSALFDRLAIPAVRWEAGTHPAFHPGRTAWLRLEGALIGVAGEIHPMCASVYGLTGRVYAAELDLQTLAAYTADVAYTAPSRFPVVAQDIAVVVPAAVPAGEVAALVRRSAGPLCRSLRLFDVYTGDQVGAGKRSLAFALTFQAPDRTLTVEEVKQVRERIEAELASAFGAALRSA